MFQPVHSRFSLKVSKRLSRVKLIIKWINSRITRKHILKCLRYFIFFSFFIFLFFKTPRFVFISLLIKGINRNYLQQFNPCWNRQEPAANFRDHIDLSRIQWLYWDKYKKDQCSHYTGTASILHVTLSLFISYSVCPFLVTM